MEQEIIAAIIVSAIAFFTVFALTPFLIKALEKRNSTVKDYHRKGGAMVARPGGPSLIAGILISGTVLYAFFPMTEIIAILITTALAFLVGLVDDKKVMGGWFKPLALAAAAIPILLLGAFDSNLAFPLFGEVKIPLLYPVIVVIMIVITGNTINSIDVLNGVASGFMVIAGSAITISLIILENYEIAMVSLLLVLTSLAFYKYHKYPCKIFPGDSGALTLGAMYGAIAIVGQVEVIAAIALGPAIFNSFLFLSSMKRIVEHRAIKEKPVELTEDFKLKATSNKKASVTLVRLILAGGRPLSEKEIGFVIFKLTIFSGILAIITAFMMGVSL
ncbi:phospho-N-acetylmuramoyl-pentapeptide-transferase [archaeon MnTg01]|nr:phospho-N-acetylmuramoyl-pentapeptide-transferase [archaeon MnTg01]